MPFWYKFFSASYDVNTSQAKNKLKNLNNYTLSNSTRKKAAVVAKNCVW